MRSGRERRRHPREPLMRYLQINARGWSDFSVWAHDVSRGGVGLAVDRPMTVGDRFLFGTDDGKQIAAEVCSVRQQGDDERYWVGLRWVAEPRAPQKTAP